MCFPTSKIPQTANNDQVSYGGYVRHTEPEIKKVLEQSGRHPLSVGKERPRAK